jgi:hypothetical protein
MVKLMEQVTELMEDVRGLDGALLEYSHW